MIRFDGRANDELRAVDIILDFTENAAGSVLISMGKTRVLCTVSIQDSVPPFLTGKGQGWLTAEYSMLPGATAMRNKRERNRISGRTQEIQRLIGRSLRAVIDLKKLGERTLICDCDVLQADGGTRTASITGAYLAMALAVKRLMDNNKLEENPLTHLCAAISVGIVQGKACLDLCYQEDSQADVDMNVVMNDMGQLIEIQGTGEGQTFTQTELMDMLKLADLGIQSLIEAQKKVLGF